MRSLSPGVAAALSSGTVILAQLVEMHLTSVLRLNTSSWNLEWGGQTWIGAASVGRIDAVEDQPGELRGLSFQLSGVPSSMLALALSEPVQGKRVNVYTAIFGANCQILDAVLEWSGRLDTMPIEEDGETATITVNAEHIGLDLLRPSGVNFSNQDQQRRSAGDRFFEYVVDQADQEIVWPAASYFRR